MFVLFLLREKHKKRNIILICTLLLMLLLCKIGALVIWIEVQSILDPMEVEPWNSTKRCSNSNYSCRE